ncbi:GATA transcription factor 23 [Hibiscus syriacus]|uniref:GATA transcription factor 23 n=2 Tax=Hibiscus syriacus TaxID=106335 RepID=A0A6A2XJL1_HIBSY|nr:GATA transcription factor 23 [Hibiscus syriacus]
MMSNNDKFPCTVHNGEETNCFSNTNNATRACSDCNKTTTPLRRRGSRGPKSLCNACGIRQRKARRALEAAANGAAVVTDAAPLKIKVHGNKEMKKSRRVYKKQLKSNSGNNCLHAEMERQKRLCLKEFGLSLSRNSGLRRVFPRDVEDAAILPMELSCGFSHS